MSSNLLKFSGLLESEAEAEIDESITKPEVGKRFRSIWMRLWVISMLLGPKLRLVFTNFRILSSSSSGSKLDLALGSLGHICGL
jgi:hypothetical protein